MIKSDQPVLWVDKHVIKRIWGQRRRTDGEWTGAYIERLKSDDVGAYYASYYTNLMTCEATEGDSFDKAMAKVEAAEAIHDPDRKSEFVSKSKEKGARLKFYPKDTKFYRCSRGITRPTVEQIHKHFIDLETESEFREVFSVSKEIVAEGGEVLNQYRAGYYKRNKETQAEYNKRMDAERVEREHRQMLQLAHAVCGIAVELEEANQLELDADEQSAPIGRPPDFT
jgi:hypothetical protein